MFSFFMVWTSLFLFVEIARIDRVLMSYLLKSFDFWFLTLSLIAFVSLQMYGPIGRPDVCSHGDEYLGNTLTVICSNYFYFWINLASFFADATPFVSARMKIAVLVLCLLNALRLFVYDRVPGFVSPFCAVPIYYKDSVVSNTHDLCLGFFLTVTVFQIRYIYRQLAMPGTFALLNVPLKVQSFEQ